MLLPSTFVQSTHELASDGLQQPFITEELVMQTALKYLGALAAAAPHWQRPSRSVVQPAAKPKQDKYTVKVPGGLGFRRVQGLRELAGCLRQSTPRRPWP